ncbi:DUF4340 domain-containing protein [Roseomonas sp. NAR14]|uniref:DUF4340 domain-containing protein n=1 Tax=Roseomonas acroporae TaxID=2937791 RepID=A0A9X1Y6G5_9PROT|nr:DUF4340 domain-containing protein [Roseomonas acroporae]MCK8782912.1 DUF4340 domain-containing protein [Roseomonas acroporae]
MNRRHLLLLGGAAVATVGAALLLTPGTTPPGDASRAPRLAFPGLAERLARAARIEAKANAATLVLARPPDGAWGLPDKANYPVRPERVHELLAALTELRLVEPRTSDPAALARLGLDEPSEAGSTATLLRVLDAAGAPLAELVIGNRRPRPAGERAASLPDSLYVRRPGETQAWVAEGRLALDPDPQSWLDRDIAGIARDRLRRAVIRRQGQPELVITRSGEPDSKLAVTTPADAPPQDETALDEVARALEFLSFVEVRPVAEAEGGRLGEALGESRLEYTDNLAVTARAWRQDERLWVALAAEGDAEAARLNARWRGWAYQLGQWKEKAFVPTLDDLRRPTEPPAAPAAADGAAPAQPGAPARPPDTPPAPTQTAPRTPAPAPAPAQPAAPARP